MNRPNLALVGFMGTGKSVLGPILAQRLGLSFVDVDDEIVRRAGQSIPRIFETEGEFGFRRRERDAIADLCDRSDRVIAAGGGAVLDPRNLAAMRAGGIVVCLWADADAIWARVRGDANRPLLAGPDPRGAIDRLLAEREPVYRSIDPCVDTTGRSLEETADRLESIYRAAENRAPCGD